MSISTAYFHVINLSYMEILGKLFGSNHIIKILRLFLFNPSGNFEQSDIVERTKVPEEIVRVEKAMLERIGLIKKRSFFKDIERKKGKKTVVVKKRVQGWGLDPSFVYLPTLERFFVDTATIDTKAFLKKLRKGGSPKLVIVSGFFMGDIDEGNDRLDLLVVGDALKEKRMLPAIKDIEAEMGKEVRYATFSTKDFKYRLDIRDRLVRDILDYPHKIIIDKLGLSQ